MLRNLLGMLDNQNGDKLMSDKQKAIDEVDKAVESINSGNNLAAIEHAEKAMKLDPTVTGAYDMMGIACLQLANSFHGTPDSASYEKRSLAAFKQAARMGSKSAIAQLAHLGVSWEYPKCAICGGYADPEADIEVLVKCKCGVDVSINLSSVDKNSGATVVHDNLADYSAEQGPKSVRCKYSTYVPPTVWCPECQANFVAGWERLLVSETSSKVEEAKGQHHPIPRLYRQMAGDLISKHGPLKRVKYLSHFPKFEINFVFEKKTVYSGERRGQYDIHFLSLGYFGEGPRYAREFLAEAGFAMTPEDIEAIKPGAVIQLKDGTVVVEYPTEREGAETSSRRVVLDGQENDRPPSKKWWQIWK